MTTRSASRDSLHLYLLPARRRFWHRAPATTVELLLGTPVAVQVRAVDPMPIPAGAS